jgi:hypothetical protein
MCLDERPLRRRQHGTLFSFSQKNSRCEFFCEKDQVSSALPEPALSVVEWGEMLCQVSNHVSSVNEMNASESRPSRTVRDGRDRFSLSRRQRASCTPKYGSSEFTLNACAVLGIIQTSYTHCQGEKDV